MLPLPHHISGVIIPRSLPAHNLSMILPHLLDTASGQCSAGPFLPAPAAPCVSPSSVARSMALTHHTALYSGVSPIFLLSLSLGFMSSDCHNTGP